MARKPKGTIRKIRTAERMFDERAFVQLAFISCKREEGNRQWAMGKRQQATGANIWNRVRQFF